MGLSSTLSNALGGMNASQRGIDVVSRNIANQGTPGYHRQAVVIQETAFGTSAQVRASTLSRAFSEALEKQHLVAVSQTANAQVKADFLDRWQMHLGQPGSGNSLDTLYGKFENALQALATNPNDVTTRAGVINAAQQIAEQLNSLSGAIQEMRRETESQIANGVSEINRQLTQLADVNVRILDLAQDPQARLALMDERDRLVASISEKIDIKATYRADGTVALMTESGVGILDVEPSLFSFRSGAGLGAGALFDADPAKSGVGQLTLRTPSGFEIDLGGQKLLGSGSFAALMDLRDGTLVDAQNQLDEIAAGLAMAMSTVNVQGTAIGGANPGDPAGFAIDLAGMQPGNSMVFSYTDGSGTHTVRVVHSEQGTQPKSPNSAGERVIGMDLRDAGAVAAQLGAMFGPAVDFSANGSTLSIVNDPASGTTIAAVGGQRTAGPNDAGAFNLFVDGNGAFSNGLDGAGQKQGFAGRIKVNSALILDPTLLVKYGADVSLGDATRPNALLESLKTMGFVSDKMTDIRDGGVRLSGKVSDLIGQMINHQGNVVSKAQSQNMAVRYTLDSITTRMAAEYGVNVDEEMARLMQLQNAYAASARVVSTVQELIDTLLRM